MRNKNKTLATWLTFLGGPLGLHRFYLHGLGDTLGWLFPVPTALGLYGIERIATNGIDDQVSWALVPLLGFTIAACALTAIIYGLMTPEKWNARFNPQLEPDAAPGRTNWSTVFGIAAALEGYVVARTPWWQRILLAAGGLCLTDPSLMTDIVGVAAIVIVVVLQIVMRKRSKPVAA